MSPLCPVFGGGVSGRAFCFVFTGGHTYMNPFLPECATGPPPLQDGPATRCSVS